MALIEVLRKYKFVQAPDTEVYVYILYSLVPRLSPEDEWGTHKTWKAWERS